MTPDELPTLQQALRDAYPSVQIDIKEPDRHNELWMEVATARGKRYLFKTPKDVDYRRQDWAVWLHRFSLLIKEKVSP